MIMRATLSARALAIVAVAMSALAAPLWAQGTAKGGDSFDILIRGGRVVDGTGNPWFYADIGVRGDTIAAVGNLDGDTARQVIDASGLYVTPGFIDVHSHAAPPLANPALAHGEPLLAQGITTIVGNPDGGGPVDLVAQRAGLEKSGLGLNVALMVPHGSVREAVLGMQDRDPTAAELVRMEGLVRKGMEAGAFGLSDGPWYAPASYSKTAEIIALAKVAAQYGGVYSSHIRDESDYNVGLIAAVDEVIRISREAALPGIVTHIKALGPHVWGYSSAIVERIQRARDAGIQVYADQYPYEASGTSVVGALVPRWALVGGDSALMRRIDSPAERARLRAAIVDNLERRGGAARLQISDYGPEPALEGKTLAEVAEARGVEPADLAMDLLKKGDPGLVSFNMSEFDIETFMRQSWTMTCTDGSLVPMGQGVPHPRFYGAFPRKIRKYVEEEHVLSLAAAIRSMTGLPAQVFGLQDRGRLESGRRADILVFDLSRLRDMATYTQPHQLAVGMVDILVNGGLVMQDGHFTDGRYGRVLTRGPRTRP
jgi:N-acyl-D-amino-acid deacylase